MDTRYQQMEREFARYHWKDAEEQRVVQQRLASMIDTLPRVELRSNIVVSNFSTRLKEVLKTAWIT